MYLKDINPFTQHEFVALKKKTHKEALKSSISDNWLDLKP